MKNYILFKLFSFSFIFVFLAVTTFADPSAIGIISYVEGRVDVTRDGLEKAVRASEEDTVMLGDIIRTKTGARVEIKFKDDTVLYLAPNSRVGIEKFLLGKGDKRENAFIKLYRGKIRSIVSKYGKKGNFHIKTPSATGTVKGTDVFAIYQADMTNILVNDGAIQVRSHDFPDKVVTIKEGYSLLVPLNEEIGAQRAFLDPEIKMHIKDTEPSFTSGPKLDGKGVVVMKGKITSLSGDVMVIKSGGSKAHKAEFDEVLEQGDKLMTGDDSKVEFILENGNTINMQPNSEILLKSVKYDPKSKEYENLFESDYGKIKAVIEKVGKKSTFKIKTPTAVCGARGTVMYLNISQTDTTAFFEGGQGDLTNLLSGDATVIDAGENSTADASGRISVPVETGSNQIMGMDEAFDGPGSMEGYSRPEGTMSYEGSEGGGFMGRMGDLGGQLEEGGFGADGEGMMDPETMEALYTAASDFYLQVGVELTTEATDFMGSFGLVDGNGNFVGSPTDTNFVKGRFVFDIPSNSAGQWATAADGSSVLVSLSANNSISGTYARPNPTYSFWESDVVRYEASDGGVIAGVVAGGMGIDKMGGKFIGFYIDPTQTGGTMSAIFMADVFANGTFSKSTGMPMPVFFNKRGTVGIIPSALDINTFVMDTIYDGVAKGDFTNGIGTATGTITGQSEGESIHMANEPWGIWWVQSQGTYSGQIQNNWKIALGGKHDNGTDITRWIGTARGIAGPPGETNRPEMSWGNGMILGEMKGFWLIDNDGAGGTMVTGGHVMNGDFVGDYGGGVWQAGGGGEWADITELLDEAAMGLSAAQFNAFVDMGNIVEAANSIVGANTAAMSNVAMSSNFYANGGPVNIWTGYISGAHDGSVANGWTLNLGNTDGDAVSLTNGTWANNTWTADVTGSLNVGKTFTGQVAGTYDDASGDFEGVGAGQWAPVG